MVTVSTAVWERSSHNGSRLLVLLYLAYRADCNGVAWPPVSVIAKMTKLKTRYVRRVLRALERSGELTIRAGAAPTRSHGNLYTICLPESEQGAVVSGGRGVRGVTGGRGRGVTGGRGVTPEGAVVSPLEGAVVSPDPSIDPPEDPSVDPALRADREREARDAV
jgi:hypothetical protein